MTIKNSIIVILITQLLLIYASSFAQSKGKQATEILQEVTDKTLAYESIKIAFTYKMENPDANINEITNGNALVSGDKYKLNIAGQVVISDGETVWTIIPDAEEVQINAVSEDGDGFSITKMLSDYNKDYKSKLIPKITELNGRSIYALELTPKERKTFDKVFLYIEKDKMQLYSIEIHDQNNSIYTYTITEFEPNTGATDSDFNFAEADYPDYEVIDMR
nr:outer membrane lipoprotein carrier protein LolA [Bacteroidota bacterium]